MQTAKSNILTNLLFNDFSNIVARGFIIAMNTKEQLNILYGQSIEVEASGHICGTVNGKIKNMDAYIVDTGEIDNVLWNTGTYSRIPNRHLVLDWGHFSGKKGEIVVLKEEIVKVHK